MTETILQAYPENIRKAIQETLSWQERINKKELTDREQEVLYFISLGWNEQEVSKALNIATAKAVRTLCEAHLPSRPEDSRTD